MKKLALIGRVAEVKPRWSETILIPFSLAANESAFPIVSMPVELNIKRGCEFDTKFLQIFLRHCTMMRVLIHESIVLIILILTLLPKYIV